MPKESHHALRTLGDRDSGRGGPRCDDGATETWADSTSGCRCARKRWSECPHPWYMAYTFDGEHHRFNLNKRAGKSKRDHVSKTEAETLYARYRTEIREGTFQQPDDALPVPSADARLTMRDVAACYDERYINAPSRRRSPTRTMSWYMRAVREVAVPARNGTTVVLGDRVLADVTRADIEALRAHWLTRKRPLAKDGLVGVNRMLRRVRHFFNWAVEEGYIDATPFRRNGRPVIKLDHTVEAGRTRRLEPGEEEALLVNATAYLRHLIIALLDTGCRLGELLGLRWRDVRLDDHLIVLQASATKTNAMRVVPVSQRVTAILEMRRLWSRTGEPLGSDAYVFGNEVGERRKNVRHGWNLTVLRAHGHEPVLVRGKLGPESRRVLEEIDLHLHDLRRECGSRLLEAGVGIHEVREWLGHKDISTTGRYLAITGASLQRALGRLEASHTDTTHANQRLAVSPVTASRSEPLT